MEDKIISIPITPETILLAKRAVWFQDYHQTLNDPLYLAAHVLTRGTHVDVKILEKYIGRSGMIKSLQQMPPGIIDPRSWSYWHLVLLNQSPPPPLPVRTF